jgi:predicted RNase H-like nuclease (RuvC/YqgF family)
MRWLRPATIAVFISRARGSGGGAHPWGRRIREAIKQAVQCVSFRLTGRKSYGHAPSLDKAIGGISGGV